MKSYLAILPASALILAAGCRELPSENKPAEAVAEVQSESPVHSADAAGSVPASTICEVYRKHLSEVQVQRNQEPELADLELQEAAFETIIANTCD